jgi:outer membrane cobalamin receptor
MRVRRAGLTISCMALALSLCADAWAGLERERVFSERNGEPTGNSRGWQPIGIDVSGLEHQVGREPVNKADAPIVGQRDAVVPGDHEGSWRGGVALNEGEGGEELPADEQQFAWQDARSRFGSGTNGSAGEERPGDIETDEEIFDMSLEELMNVEVVSATRTAKTTRTAPSIITSISAAQIEESGARTLSDLLKMTVGIQVLGRRNGRDMVWIRGAKDGYNSSSLLLIDGIPIRDISFRSWSPDEIIPLNNIDRIEIIRGPGSALYGGNASSGIISIFTKKCSRRTSLAVGYGSFDTAESEFHSGYCGKDWNVFVAGNYHDTKGHPMNRDRSGNPTTHRDESSARNVNARISYKALDFGIFRNELTTGYPLYPSTTDKPQRFANTSAFMSYTLNGDEYFIKPQLYYFRSDVEYDRKQVDEGGLLVQRVLSNFESQSYGFDNQVTLKTPVFEGLSSNVITAGVSGEYHKIGTFAEEAVAPSPETLLWMDHEGDRTPDSYDAAVYLQDELNLLEDRLGLVGGVRYDYYKGFGGEVSPRVGGVATPLDDLTFKVLWGTAFSPPTFLEMYMVSSGTRGSSDLEPERIRTLETEVSYLFGKIVNARAVYFNNGFSNFIKVDPDRDVYVNASETRKTSGVELDVRLRFRPALSLLRAVSLETNYTYTDTRDEAGEKIGSVAMHTANMALVLKNDYVTFFNGLNYVGSRNNSETYHRSVTDAGLRERDNLGAYFIWDTNLIVSSFSKWPLVKVVLTVQNVLNKEHYNPTLSDVYYDYTRKGRTVSMKMSFDM